MLNSCIPIARCALAVPGGVMNCEKEPTRHLRKRDFHNSNVPFHRGHGMPCPYDFWSFMNSNPQIARCSLAVPHGANNTL
jgi:hypothetical protein